MCIGEVIRGVLWTRCLAHVCDGCGQENRIITATASLISRRAGGKVETAMQATGTDYASISATGHGFINPLKTLLTSRTAVLRLGGIPSKINAVLSACLNSDSGTDYAQVANRVLFAGNLTGAAAGPAPISVWSETGTERTSIGITFLSNTNNTLYLKP